MKTIIIIILLIPSIAFSQETIMGFQNPDGSEDRYNLNTGEYQMGFQNPDGSQDTIIFEGYESDTADSIFK